MTYKVPPWGDDIGTMGQEGCALRQAALSSGLCGGRRIPDADEEEKGSVTMAEESPELC